MLFHKPSSLLCTNCNNDCNNDSSPYNNKCNYKSNSQAWQTLFASRQNRCQQWNQKKVKQTMINQESLVAKIPATSFQQEPLVAKIPATLLQQEPLVATIPAMLFQQEPLVAKIPATLFQQLSHLDNNFDPKQDWPCQIYWCNGKYPNRILSQLPILSLTQMNWIMREHGLKQPLFKPPSWLLILPKHHFTSAKIAVYFVRENGSNSGNLTNTTASLSSALSVTLELQD